MIVNIEHEMQYYHLIFPARHCFAYIPTYLQDDETMTTTSYYFNICCLLNGHPCQTRCIDWCSTSIYLCSICIYSILHIPATECLGIFIPYITSRRIRQLNYEISRSAIFFFETYIRVYNIISYHSVSYYVFRHNFSRKSKQVGTKRVLRLED